MYEAAETSTIIAMCVYVFLVVSSIFNKGIIKS